MIKILFVPIELIHSLYGLLGVTKCQLEQIITHFFICIASQRKHYHIWSDHATKQLLHPSCHTADIGT